MGLPLRTKILGGMLAVSLALAGKAWAAEAPAEETLEVPEVVVGAMRLPDVPLDLRKVPANVTVINAEDIRRSGALTVQDALQSVPGIVMYDQVGNRFQQTLDMRGFNGQPTTGVTVYVDGVRVNEPEFNDVNFHLIPLESIERIEVIPGPSAIFGRNTLAGAVNIVTKRGGEKQVAVAEMSGGSFGNQRYVGTVGGPLPGGFDYRLGATREFEDGPRDNSAARLTHFEGKLGYRYRDLTDLTFSYTRADDTIRQAGSLTRAELDRDRTGSVTPGETGALVHTFTLNGRQRLPWGFSAAANAFLRNRNTDGTNVGRALNGAFELDSTSGGGTGQVSHEARFLSAHNTFTAGGEYRRNDTDNRALNTFFFFVTPTFAIPFPSQVHQALREDAAGFFAQNVLELYDRVALTAGIRYDRTLFHLEDQVAAANTGFQRSERVTPRAGVTVTLAKDLSAYFSYAEGFRSPSSQEVLGVAPFKGNLHLLPVTSRNFELGVRGKLDTWLEASAAAFTNRLRNEILFVALPPFGTNANIPATRRQGVELTLRPRYRDLVEGNLTYTFTEATFRTNFPLCSFRDAGLCPGPGGIIQPVQEGDHIPQVPRHRLTGGVDVHPISGLTVGLSTIVVGRQVAFGDEANLESKLPGYATLNAKVTYRWRDTTVFLFGDNITNGHYSTRAIWANPTTLSPDLFLVPAPGWSVRAGLGYRFDLPAWGPGAGGQGTGQK